MSIHVIDRRQIIRTNPEICWAFFSNPANLSKITPPELDFNVRSQLPAEIYPGMCILYWVRPLFGLRLGWMTEITQVRKPVYFCDEQRSGPYRIWHHEHFFEDLGDGRIEIRDLVHYQVPFSPIGDLFEPLIVRPQLERIFEFRRITLEKLFP